MECRKKRAEYHVKKRLLYSMDAEENFLTEIKENGDVKGNHMNDIFSLIQVLESKDKSIYNM